MTAVTINGNAYSDDGSQSRDMRFGGHQQWLLPMLQDAMTEVEAATDAAVSADSSAAAAATSASNAANYAAALNGTSTSSNDIGTGSKTWTTQTGKQFGVGGYVQIIRQSDTTMWMIGQVTAYNAGTGSITVNVEDSNGSGNFSGWDIRVAGKRGAQGLQGIAGAGIPTTTGNALKHLRVNSAANGAEWVDRPFSNVQVFTSTGTFTPPSGVSEFFVILTGGGAGGVTTSGGGDGGGAGFVFGLLTISSAQTVTIGGAGANGNPPTAGGNSSIGSLATANGGAIGSSYIGGDGGSATCADSGCVAIEGNRGFDESKGAGSSYFGVNGYGAGGHQNVSGYGGPSKAPKPGIAIFMW